MSGVELSLGTNSNRVGRTASLDRIDSSKGYIEGNIQWVHKDINFMKQEMDENSFFCWCGIIAKFKKPASSL